MAMPVPPESTTPALISSSTAQAIRDALIDEERTEFEQRFAEEMAEAARTLDLTGVLNVLSEFRWIAEVTRFRGEEVHREMLDTAARLLRGEDVQTIPGHVRKAQINSRLGRLRVYSYEDTPAVSDQIDMLPQEALPFYAELITFLELSPWEGRSYRAEHPDGNLRSMPFGANAEGLAAYVTLEEQRRVVVVNVIWAK